MGSLWGSLPVITKRWTLSSRFNEKCRHGALAAKFETGHSWKVHFLVSQLEPRASRNLLWCDMTLCELGGESPTLRSTQNCGCEQSSRLWLCFLVSPWDDAWFFWGVLWLCRCFMALNCLQRSCEWGLARHRGCGMFSWLYFFQHYWECPSWWEKSSLSKPFRFYSREA